MDNIHPIRPAVHLEPAVQQEPDKPPPRPTVPTSLEPLFTPQAIARYEQMAVDYLAITLARRCGSGMSLKARYEQFGLSPSRWRKVLVLEEVDSSLLSALIEHVNVATDIYNFDKRAWLDGGTDSRNLPVIHGIRYFNTRSRQPTYVTADLSEHSHLVIASSAFSDCDKHKKLTSRNLTRAFISCR